MEAKTKKYLIWSAIALIVFIAIYFLFLKKDKEETIDLGEAVIDPFPLKKGSRGKEVEQLQMYLLKEYGASFPMFGVDGIWGDETDANVKKFLNRDNISKEVYQKWNLSQFKTSKF
jgi:hypothetical protein